MHHCNSNGLELKMGQFGLDIRKKLSTICGATLEQVAKRSCRCPVPRKVQSHVEQVSGQPDLDENVTVH